MITEAINRILQLGEPKMLTVGSLDYSSKPLTLITPPDPDSVKCSTLQGLVDLYNGQLDDAASKHAGDLLVHITSPTSVQLVSRETDSFARRRVWAEAKYPECKSFPFGTWLDPESFIIAASQHFQRVKIENTDGSLAPDLEYVMGVASKITADHSAENSDDGLAQRVTVRQGITLKAETVLRPVISLAPYRTFAEIDQVVSTFVFRARVSNGAATLALFEGDGGRWKIAAAAAIKAWLAPKFGDVPVIS